MTNGDKIRQMSNEELAWLLDGHCNWCKYDMDDRNCSSSHCLEGIKAYLDMEIQE